MEEFEDEPDRSKSDYHCQVCDSHMNSYLMWMSHIQGKRHIKNISKAPGEAPSKVKAVKLENAVALLDKELENITGEPVVGLQYITELQRLEAGVAPIYTCYLCNAAKTSFDVVEHILSSKHRLFFLKKEDPQSYGMIENLILSKEVKDSLIDGKAAEWERLSGRGRIEVKTEKPNTILTYRDRKRHWAEYERAKRRKSTYAVDHRDSSLPNTSSDRRPRAITSSPAPSTGSTPSSSGPTRPPTPPASAESLGLDPQGLDFNNISRFPMDVKVHLVAKLADCTMETPENAAGVMHAMNIILQTTTQRKIRKMRPRARAEYARLVLDPDCPTVDGVLRKLNARRLFMMGKPLTSNAEQNN